MMMNGAKGIRAENHDCFTRLCGGLFCALSVVVMVLNGFGCGNGAGGQVGIEGVWIRENIAPQKVTAAYMVVRNGGEATALVLASTDVAEVTELHVMTARENVMLMRRVEKIPIPEGGVTTLQPGGNHLMLIGLRRDLTAGEKVELVLGFENGQKVAVQAVVKAMGNGN